MNPTGLLLFLACCFVSRAQSTNAPARLDYPSFKIITERNIFDPNRSARSGKGARTDSQRPARSESFALVGTLSYEKGKSRYVIVYGQTPRALKHGVQELIFYHLPATVEEYYQELEKNGISLRLDPVDQGGA